MTVTLIDLELNFNNFKIMNIVVLVSVCFVVAFVISIGIYFVIKKFHKATPK